MGLFSGLLSIGGSLLGGILGKNDAKKATARQNEYNDPSNVRQRAEDAGFNPLLFVGPGVGNQAAPYQSGHMGAAVADASMMAANMISGQAENKARVQNLQLQNEKLQKEINQMTIRPATAGLYSAGGPSLGPIIPKATVARDWDPEKDQGPRQEVRVINGLSGGWLTMPPGVADALELKEGQTAVGDKFTQWLGETAGEARTLGSIADGATKRARDAFMSSIGTPPTAPSVVVTPQSPPRNFRDALRNRKMWH